MAEPIVIRPETAGAYPVTLTQHGPNRFTVTYGSQVTARIDYSRTAAELGYALLHALACEGRLRNE